jgi:hypothetical protein
MYTESAERDHLRERALNVLEGRSYFWKDPVRDDGPAMTAALCTRPTLWLLPLKEFDSRSAKVKLYSRMACKDLPDGQRQCVRRATACRSGKHHAPAGFATATREHVHPHLDGVRSSCWACQQQKLSRDPTHLAKVLTWERLLHSPAGAPLSAWDGELR